jgi:GMP synthase (glutamine-hydrolysing)
MRKIMVFQHVGHEPLGTLDPLLKAAGFRIRYVNFGRHPETVPSLDGYNGLIVLGGPMGVYEAKQYPHLYVEMKLIEEALKRNIPVLGICLGAQLIAATLGAQVCKAQQWEFGWHDLEMTTEGNHDPFFGAFKTTEKVFQIHQDTFDMPSGAKHLARSALCSSQAFRFSDNVYGLQFHLEVDHAMIVRWIHRPENQKLIADLQAAGHLEITQDNLIADTDSHILRSLELSHASFSRFIDIFKLPERPVVLGSTHGKPKKWNE